MKRIRRGVNFIKELESQQPACPVCDSRYPLIIDPSVNIDAWVIHTDGYFIKIDVDNFNSRHISRHVGRKINYCPMCGRKLGR